MQEVLSASRSERGILSDAGPSSRLDTIIYDDTPSNSRRSSSVQPYVDAEDAELLETARSLSLTVEDNVYAQSEHEDLLNSPRSLDGSTLDAYSVIEPTSRSGSPLASRSQSPLIVDAPFSSISGFKTPSTHSQQDLTAAYLRQFEEREVSHQKTRAASPTPTIRSLTAKTLDNPSSHGSPSYVPSISQAHSQPSSSRPISPFSEIGFISAHSSDSENEVQRTESASDRESQWSDLGEDSSDGE